MIINKKRSIITLMSTAVLLSLYTANTSQTVHADTVKGADVVQTNNQNNKEAQKTAADSKTTTNNVATQKQNGGVKTPTQTTTDKESKTEINTASQDLKTNSDKDVIVTVVANSDTIDHGDNTSISDVTNQNIDSENINIANSEDNVTPVETSIQITDKKDSKPQYELNDEALKVLKNAEVDLKTLNKEQIDQINKINFQGNNPDGSTKWTYSQLISAADKVIKQDKRYRIPYFNANMIKNMPATTTRNAQSGKVEKLDIWDSWAVQDAKTGKVVNYKGYQLMIAMMGVPSNWNDGHLYLLYNKYNDNNLNHWKCAGAIFGYKASQLHQEWSGSATLNKNGTIQLFFADNDIIDGVNRQRLATANIRLKVNKKKNTINIAKVSNRHILFEGDGYYYQTYDQWKSTRKGDDEWSMRDAHVISVKGRRYLIFETATGDANYSGESAIYNWKNYGGTDKEAMQNFLKLTSNTEMRNKASWNNSAIGIIRLSKSETNPKVDRIMPPLVTSLMTSDEIERPTIIPMNGKYYLFTATRLDHGIDKEAYEKANVTVGDNVVMLGWVSNYFDHGYKPLNDDGVVLVASVPKSWRTATYAYYPVPVNGSKNEVLVTSYMSNRGNTAGKDKYSTMAPAFIVKINKDGTTSVVQKATNQGDWVYDKKSVNKKMLVKTIKGAHLKGEPTDRSLLKTQEA